MKHSLYTAGSLGRNPAVLFFSIHGDRTQKNGRCFTTVAIYKSTIYKNIYISKKAVFLQVINSYFHGT